MHHLFPRCSLYSVPTKAETEWTIKDDGQPVGAESHTDELAGAFCTGSTRMQSSGRQKAAGANKGSARHLGRWHKHWRSIVPSQGEFRIGRRSVLGLAAAASLPSVLAPQAADAAVAAELSASTAYATPERAPIKATRLSGTSKSPSDIMVAMDKTRTRGWNCYSTTLKESRDEGVTWKNIRTVSGEWIEAVLPLDNGELLVFVHVTATTMRKAYLSNGYGSGSASWSVVLTGANPQVRFSPGWGLSAHENIVVVNEYGPKSGSTWQVPNEIIAEGKNARYTYLSLDYGRTWATIFDLNAWLTAKGLSTKGQHLHGVAWDPYWDRIWLNFGDKYFDRGVNGILFSDDLGATWQEAHFLSGPGGAQTVGILPMPRCILLAGDVNPSGLLRINRSEGKMRSGHYTLDVAYDAPAELGMHLGESICHITRVGDDAPAFFGFCSDVVSGVSFVIGTYDGYTVTEVWRDTAALPSRKGTRNVVGPTLRGNLIVASNDERVAGKWSEFKGKAPGY